MRTSADLPHEYRIQRRERAHLDGGPTNFGGTGYEVVDAESGERVTTAAFVCDARLWIDQRGGVEADA